MTLSTPQRPLVDDSQRLGKGARPGTIITFYSYKGGTGRSMSLANVAWILASAGNRVLAIDWDLEAPGLHRYFSPFLRDRKLIATEGIINFADQYKQKAMTPPADSNAPPQDWYLAYADLSHFAVRLNWDFADGYLDLVPAGQQDEGYSALVNSFNWKTFFVDLGGNRLLDAVKQKLREDYDYVLIDSRTGVSDTSGICTVKMPDILVVCFTLNNQSIDGAASVANDVYNQRGDAVRIFPVPMRLDNGELQKLEARSEQARKQFFRFPNDAGTATREQYWTDIPVSYVTYYAYEEVLAAFGEKDARIASMLASAERLTSYLTDGRVVKLSPPPEILRLKKLAQYEGREVELTPAGKVSEAAQAGFRRLNTEDQKNARRVLLRLVRVSRPEEKTEPSRQRVVLADLGTRGTSLVSKLIERQLIGFAGKDDQGNEMFEIVNDELLLGWPELNKWISDDREFLLWRQQLRAIMAEWKQGKRNQKWLASHAPSEARRWLKTRQDDLTVDEVTFIRACVSAENWRWFKIAAAIIVVVTMLGAYRLITQTRTSNKDRTDAETLASEGQRQVDMGLTEAGLNEDHLQVGALLALESESLSPSDKARTIVNRAISKLILTRRVTSIKYDSSVMKIVWSPDGKTITTVVGRHKDVDLNGAPSPTREDRTIEVRDVASKQRVAGPISFKTDVQKFGVSSDGRYVAFSVVGQPKDRADPNIPSFVIELLDLASGEQTAIDVRQAPIYSLVFSPDSRYMISTGNENTAVLVDVSTRKVLKKIRHQGTVIAATFSPDSKLIATVSDDYYARVWRVSDPEGAATKYPIRIGGVASKVVFTPDGLHLITLLGLSGSSITQIWDLENQQGTSLPQLSIVLDVAVSADGKYIATLGENGEIRVWDGTLVKAPSNNYEPTPLQYLRTEGNLSRIKFSSGPLTYLVATGDRTIASVWKLPDFTYAGLMTSNGRLNDIAFDPAGRLAMATETVQVWQFESGSAANPCEYLTRNLTPEEWKQFLPNRPYRLICPDIPAASQ